MSVLKLMTLKCELCPICVVVVVSGVVIVLHVHCVFFVSDLPFRLGHHGSNTSLQ